MARARQINSWFKSKTPAPFIHVATAEKKIQIKFHSNSNSIFQKGQRIHWSVASFASKWTRRQSNYGDTLTLDSTNQQIPNVFIKKSVRKWDESRVSAFRPCLRTRLFTFEFRPGAVLFVWTTWRPAGSLPHVRKPPNASSINNKQTLHTGKIFTTFV